MSHFCLPQPRVGFEGEEEAGGDKAEIRIPGSPLLDFDWIPSSTHLDLKEGCEPSIQCLVLPLATALDAEDLDQVDMEASRPSPLPLFTIAAWLVVLHCLRSPMWCGEPAAGPKPLASSAPHLT